MKIIKTFSLAIIIVSITLTFYTMLDYGTPWKYGLQNLFIYILFGLWATSPYLSLASAMKHAHTRSTASVLLTGIITISVMGDFIYYDIFIIHQDAQSGAPFLYVPFLQWIICFICFAFLRFISKKNTV